MPNHEDEIPIPGALLGPFEIILNLDWLVILVGPNQRHIYVEAWKVKVVGIAAKECRLKFRHKDQPNICILFVTIKIVLTALIEGNNVGSQSRCLERFAFDTADRCASR